MPRRQAGSGLSVSRAVRRAGSRRLSPARRFARAAARQGRRRHPHAHAAPRPHRRRPHHHLQEERPVRRGGAEEDQLDHARLAQERSDQDGPAGDRPAVGGLSGGRRQGADPHHLRLPFARHQRHAAPPQQGRGAQFSQHTLGKAIDFYIPGVPLDKLRAAAMRLQGGGVGYYPTSGSPFVHLDIGNVRAWPRMTREQLVKLFPDGRTVHLPTDGTPLPGYRAGAGRSRTRPPRPRRRRQKRSLLASLFGRDTGRRRGRRQRDGPPDRRSGARRDRQTSRNAAAPASAVGGLGGRTGSRAAPSCRRCRCRRAGRSTRSPSAESRPVPAPAPPRRPRRSSSRRCRRTTSSTRAASGTAWPKPRRLKSPPRDNRRASVSSARARSLGAAARPHRQHRPVRATRSRPGRRRARLRRAGRRPARARQARRTRAAVVTSKGSGLDRRQAGRRRCAGSPPVQADDRLNDPWMRGLVLAPSVQNSLVVDAVRRSGLRAPRPVHAEARLGGGDDVLAAIRISA